MEKVTVAVLWQSSMGGTGKRDTCTGVGGCREGATKKVDPWVRHTLDALRKLGEHGLSFRGLQRCELRREVA